VVSLENSLQFYRDAVALKSWKEIPPRCLFMFPQEELQKKVSDFLAILEVAIQNRSSLGLFDQNLLAQPFMAKFLNILYGYDLVNLDQASKKYPAIDLGDFYRKVAFQVTSMKDSRKIQKSLDIFIQNQMYQEFNHLRFLIIGRKQKSYKIKLETQSLFHFDPCLDILDIKSLIQRVSDLDIRQLERLGFLIDLESSFLQFSRKNFDILRDLNCDDNAPIEESKPDDVERIVCAINIPLYSDKFCKHLRSDMTGIMLKSIQKPGNILIGYTLHPTSICIFNTGDKVKIVYSRNRLCGESWYIHPETQTVNYAWTEHMEVIGKTIENAHLVYGV